MICNFCPFFKENNSLTWVSSPGKTRGRFWRVSEPQLAGLLSEAWLCKTLCMMMAAGIRDVKLTEKLSEMEELTLPAFSTIIDAHLHAKATLGSTTVENKVFTPPENRDMGQNNQGHQRGQRQQRSSQGISNAKKIWCMVMKGKCYQWVAETT